MTKCGVCKSIAILAGVGALNWLFVALFGFDLVATAFGTMTTATRIIYIGVGLAGLFTLFSIVKVCPCTSKSHSK